MKRVSIYKQRWVTQGGGSVSGVMCGREMVLYGIGVKLARHIVRLHNASLKGDGK